MTNRKLTITWKPDVLSNVEHKGSYERNKENYEEDFRNRILGNNYKGLTARSERETFRNIKSKEAAQKILRKRNRKEILFATYNNENI